MNVEFDSAALHVAMVEEFGLPTPTDPDMTELFGYYHFDGDTRLWSYDPYDQTWSVKSGCGSEGRLIPSSSSYSAVDLEEVNERLGLLDLMERPTFIPEDDHELHPFIYDGWRFAWVYFLKLKRWELAPIGRR